MSFPSSNQSSPQLQLLDPRRIRISRFSRRQDFTLVTQSLSNLKLAIASAGKNVQPIKVRPLTDGTFELVFGRRRLCACLELGLQVWAIVESLSDTCVWQEMEFENRGCEHLSPFELGAQYRFALDIGVYPSMRRLAEAMGIELSSVGQMIRLSELPVEVVRAFRAPSDIQMSWVSTLCDRASSDRESLIHRAEALTGSHQAGKSARAIFAALTK